jgi:hypothetical protein
MTPLDIAAHKVLEDLVSCELLGSFRATNLVSYQLYTDVPRTIFWAIVL